VLAILDTLAGLGENTVGTYVSGEGSDFEDKFLEIVVNLATGSSTTGSGLKDMGQPIHQKSFLFHPKAVCDL